MGSGVPVGAPPTVRTAIEPNLRASPIRTRHGCSYNQYPALRLNTPERDLVLPVGAPPSVRTAIEPNLRASPIRTRHGCSYNQYPALGFDARNRDLVLPVGAPPTVRTGQAHIRTRGGCSYNKYANSHPWRLLLPREGVECLPLTSPAHHPQRHPIPERVAPAVLLHTRSYCFLLLDHSLHGNRFNLTPLLYSQMKATRESSEAIDFATVSGLRLWPFKPSRRLFP